MSKRPTVKNTGTVLIDEHEHTLPQIGGECISALEQMNIVGSDLIEGAVMAEEFIDSLFSKVDEAITVIETVKKIPDYNADYSVEQAVMTARMKVLTPDYKEDDQFLLQDQEPVSD